MAVTAILAVTEWMQRKSDIFIIEHQSICSLKKYRLFRERHHLRAIFSRRPTP